MNCKLKIKVNKLISKTFVPTKWMKMNCCHNTLGSRSARPRPRPGDWYDDAMPGPWKGFPLIIAQLGNYTVIFTIVNNTLHRLSQYVIATGTKTHFPNTFICLIP